MSVEIKVPSPGESVSEVEIAGWLVSDGDYVEKDQEIVELDSDKATLALPAEESGIISIKVEEGEAVEVGQVIGTIDTDAKKPDGDNNSGEEGKEGDSEEKTTATEEKKEEKTEKETKQESKNPSTKDTYASGTPSPAARKILEEKNIDPKDIKGSG